MKYLTYIFLIISIVLLIVSFIVFSKPDQTKINVKNFATSNLYKIPLNSTLVSYDTSQNNEVIIYITMLSQDQIIEFYNKYSLLNNWNRMGQYNFSTDKSTITIKINKESENKNLVTYREVKSN